jgi:hypothetical protein
MSQQSKPTNATATQDVIDNFLLGELVPVTSSMIRTARWDANGNELTVEFQNGDKWTYWPVDIALAADFAEAKSAGKWLAAHKGSLRGRKHG